MVEKKIRDDDTTSAEQLANYAMKYLKKHFIGITNKTPAEMKRYIIKNPMTDDAFIINLDKHHWTAIVRKNGRYHQFDSFNRNLYGKDFKQLRLPAAGVQKKREQNCGQRVLAKMIQLFETV